MRSLPSCVLFVAWLARYACGITWAGELATVLPPDADAMARVAAGQKSTVDASWWGFNPEDATDGLQAAIDSKARKVIVPLMPSPWVIRPIVLRSDLELEFRPGVLVLAKAGEFLGRGDSLFRAVERTNIAVRGYGAVLRMRKSDYQKPPYSAAEWRMGLSFTGCKGVRLEGLRVESTGGDGIYIGSSPRVRGCEDVSIRDCVCHDNHRQGISVISALNLLIERCVFSGTSGTAPEAGIDFEPDEPDERLVNCVVRQCLSENNAGNGLLVYLKPMNHASAPVSLRFEDCHVRMGAAGASAADLAQANTTGWSGIAVGKVGDDGPKGRIDFVRCTSVNTGREAVRVFDKSATGVQVRFEDCRWQGTWLGRHREFSGPRVPILFRSQETNFCRQVGGVEFVDCHLADTLDGSAVRFESDEPEGTLRDVIGRLVVKNPHGVRTQFGPRTAGVTLQVVNWDKP